MWGWCACIQDFWVQGGTRGAMSGQKLFLRLCDAAGGAVALAGWKVEGLGKEVVVACLPSRLENIPRASLGRWWQSTFHWLCASPWWSSCFCPSRQMGKSDQQACARFSSEHEPVVWRRGGRTGKQRGRGGTSPKGFSQKGGQQQFSPDCCRAFSRWTWIFLRNRKQTPRRSQRQRRRKWSVAGAWLEEFFCAEARGEGGGQRFQEERGPSAVESFVQDVGAQWGALSNPSPRKTKRRRMPTSFGIPLVAPLPTAKKKAQPIAPEEWGPWTVSTSRAIKFNHGCAIRRCAVLYWVRGNRLLTSWIGWWGRCCPLCWLWMCRLLLIGLVLNTTQQIMDTSVFTGWEIFAGSARLTKARIPNRACRMRGPVDLYSINVMLLIVALIRLFVEVR